MLEQGIVQEVKNDIAIVRIFRSSACGHCEMCGLSSDKKFIDLDVPNILNVNVDDTVEIDINGNSAVKVSLIVYLIPLVFAMLLLFVGYLLTFPDWAQIIMFLIGIVGGFFVVKYVDKKYSKKLDIIPKMTKIISKEIQK